MPDKRMDSSLDVMQAMVRFFGTATANPVASLKHSMKLTEGVWRSFYGASDLEPDRKDKRFKDNAWSTNPAFRAVMQSYLAWSRGLQDWISDLELGGRDELRARLLVQTITDSLSPTNVLLGNPAAMRATLESGGRNLIQGVRRMIEDIGTNDGMPASVDTTKFEVGGNLATTPGAVVYREDHFELLQFAPRQDKVYQRPVFIIPPQINKYYVWDLQPGRSVIEYLLDHGHQVFIVSWRNPTAAQAQWDLASYIRALDRASLVITDITGSDDMNIVGACSGGVASAMLIAYWQAQEITRAKSFTLCVAILDIEGGKDTALGLFASVETLELARMFSSERGILAGRDLGRAFAWLRPNDMIWAYWVNNYLLGQEPPVFDILYWNADTTNLPAALHSDLLDLLGPKGLNTEPGWFIDEHKIDLKNVTCDSFIVAGTTDHITPWDGCYQATGMLGGKSEFVLSSSGHIQSIINPPGNPKAAFFTNPGPHETPEEFFADAVRNEGSWWPYWMTFLDGHGGRKVKASAELGSVRYAPECVAPGSYVRVDANEV